MQAGNPLVQLGASFNSFASFGRPFQAHLIPLAAGNAAFNGQKYDEAVLHYSAALEAKANDAEFNAVLYCNRATVQSALSK